MTPDIEALTEDLGDLADRIRTYETGTIECVFSVCIGDVDAVRTAAYALVAQAARIEELEAAVKYARDRLTYSGCDRKGAYLYDVHVKLAAVLGEGDERLPHPEAAGCSGLAAQWCPVHGDCSCENDQRRNDLRCALHGEGDET